jgi:predicted metal-dependent hydrolase
MSSIIPISLTSGKTLNLQIKKSNRAKQLWLKANVHGMYIVVPTTIDYEINDILNFIDGKKKWLQRQSDYYERLKSKYNNPDVFKLGGHGDDNTISFLGTKYLFDLIKDKTSSYIIRSDNLKKITFHITVDKRKYKDHIKKWYQTQTARIISDRLPLIISNKLNLLLPTLVAPFYYNKISIKDQNSRWASCSTKRNLNFNLFLAALPVEIIDYVIIHELVHLVELNHSKKFWNLVGLADLEDKKHREWLHRYGSLVKIP